LYLKILPGMVQKRNIPLVLVTGFLGSGKTTLVKYLLENIDPAIRVGIVQNEYASASIDTTELQSVDRKFEVLEVNNGSVFCVCLLGSFIDSLAEFIDKYNPYLVLIEASGLSDPIAIAEILQHGKLVERVYLSAVWCIIDGQNYHKVSKMNTRVQRQVMIADRIIINKSDLMEVNPDALLPVLKDLNPDAEITTCTFCQVPLNLIHEPVNEPLALLKEFQHRQYEPTGRAEISTVVLRTSRPIDRKGLDTFISEVESKLIRLKGFVLLENQKVISIQSEFGHTRLSVVTHYYGNTELVGLGWDISPANFGRRFHDIRKSGEQRVN
jgi:G3E family GTPase